MIKESSIIPEIFDTDQTRFYGPFTAEVDADDYIYIFISLIQELILRKSDYD